MKIVLGLLIALVCGQMYGAQPENKAVSELNKKLLNATSIFVLDSAAVENLLERGANPNAREYSGETPLFSPIMVGSFDNPKKEEVEKAFKVIEILVTKGADVNAKNNDGMTPLMTASMYSAEFVSELLRLGADPSLQSKDGRTALSRAILHKRADVLALLVATLRDKDEDGSLLRHVINIQDNNGWTELMSAAYYNCEQCIRTLITAGADPFIKNNKGENAFSWAKTPEIKKMISDYMEKYAKEYTALRERYTKEIMGATPMAGAEANITAEYLVGPKPRLATPEGERKKVKAAPKKTEQPAPAQPQRNPLSLEEEMPEVD